MDFNFLKVLLILILLTILILQYRIIKKSKPPKSPPVGTPEKGIIVTYVKPSRTFHINPLYRI
jgi:hypothetical protein